MLLQQPEDTPRRDDRDPLIMGHISLIFKILYGASWNKEKCIDKVLGGYGIND